MGDLSVAAIQLNGRCCWQDNQQQLHRLIAEAADKGAQLVLLPENFAAMPMSDKERQTLSLPPLASEILQQLQQWSRDFHLCLVAGGMLWRTNSDSTRARNRAWVIDRQGNIVTHYDKIHRFDAQVANLSYHESASVEAGEEAVSFELEGWHFGLSICYDLRFPELYRQYSAQGAHVLLVPAAFTAATGKAHWEVLLRARAIENQCYVIAAGQCGHHDDGRTTWGHSMIIDPWGNIQAQNDTQTAIVCGQLAMEQLSHIRQQLPALGHRRLSS